MRSKEDLRRYHRAYRAANRERVAERQRTWRAHNKDRVRDYARAHYEKYPEKHRAKALRRKFGVTPARVAAMLAAQKGCCAICKAARPGGKGTWHVDHDHRTKVVRGLLCQNCNIGLGNFKDDPIRLRSAIQYLRRAQQINKLLA